MQGLAKLKTIRGTVLDPFGYTQERKMERGLIEKCESIIDRLSSELSTTNVSESVDVLETFMEIKGFGPVKELAAKANLAEIDRKLKSMTN